MKTAYITLILVFICASAFAQTAETASNEGVAASDIRVSRSEEGVAIEMRVDISRDGVHSLNGVALTPILSDGAGHSARFPSILVNGRNRARVYARMAEFGQDDIDGQPPYLVINLDPESSSGGAGGGVDYSARVEGEPWMAGAAVSLVWEIFSPAGERRSYSLPVGGMELAYQPAPVAPAPAPAPVQVAPAPVQVAPAPAPVQVAPAPEPVQQPAPAPVVVAPAPLPAPAPVQVTPVPAPAPVAVAPVAQPEPVPVPAPVVPAPAPVVQPAPAPVAVQPQPAPAPAPVAQPQPAPQPVVTPPQYQPQPAPIDPASLRAVTGSADLDFAAGTSVLNPTYGRNAELLAAIDQAIRGVAATPGARIVSITLTGHVSPDGRMDVNSSIARDRAAALARYLQQQHGIAPESVNIVAAGENWEGLRAAVTASTLPYQSEILKVIDGTQAPDAKESLMRRMMGGQIWQRMEREIFPSLRKVDYRVEYIITQ